MELTSVWQHIVLVISLVGGLSTMTAQADDDLDDFDFSDFDSDLSDKVGVADLDTPATVADNFLTADEDWETDFNALDQAISSQGYAFSNREKILRKALAKALTNATLRQRFVEILPILRVLTSQQRLALSALITAQMTARRSNPLTLEEVRSMFDDEKTLLLPIIFDIANLVSSAAFKYLPAENATTVPAFEVENRLNRREFELSASEEEEEQDMIGIETELSEEILDAQSINEKLLEPMQRQKRAADNEGEQLVHKLVRVAPFAAYADEAPKKLLEKSRMLKINTTGFDVSQQNYTQTAAELSYQQVEDLALLNLNGSLLEESTTVQATAEEALPTPEELISGPRYRLSQNKIRPVRQKATTIRKRVQAPLAQKTRLNAGAQLPLARKCERFTASMCIRTDDYPLDQIMGSIRRHKNAMTALLAEYHDNPENAAEFSEDFDDFLHNKKRRGDEGGTAGGMCQTIVRYARPQKARSASGEWKYIVNTGQHTQTLRLEKCTNPQESCSYLAHNYRSHCTQVYNYHRLLSWDKTRGLHVDIFKVPTCCTCQVDGYRQQFPPLSAVKDKDFTPVQLEPYTTINEELDYNDEEDEDDLSYHFGNAGFNKLKRDPNDFDANELQSSSKTIRTKVFPPTATVGSYLSPPDHDEFETPYGYGGKGAKNLIAQLAGTRRRPYKSLAGVSDSAANEARVDLDISPSELHTEKEVKPFGSPLPKVRKTIYSVPHTVAATSGSSSSTRYSSTSSRPFEPQTTGGRGTQQATNSATSHAAGSSSRGSRQPQSTRYIPSPSTQTSSHTSATDTFPATSAVDGTQTTKPTKYNVNAMYSSKLNATTGSKRINYNYHPIIDFFEMSSRRPTTAESTLTQRYAHTIPKTGKEQNHQKQKARMSFSGPLIGPHAYLTDNSAWQPLVLTN